MGGLRPWNTRCHSPQQLWELAGSRAKRRFLPLPHQPFPSHQSQESTQLKASRSLPRSSGCTECVMVAHPHTELPLTIPNKVHAKETATVCREPSAPANWAGTRIHTPPPGLEPCPPGLSHPRGSAFKAQCDSEPSSREKRLHPQPHSSGKTRT